MRLSASSCKPQMSRFGVAQVASVLPPALRGFELFSSTESTEVALLLRSQRLHSRLKAVLQTINFYCLTFGCL